MHPVAPRGTASLTHWILSLVAIVPAAWMPPAQAHGDVHPRILELNRQIESHPQDAGLVLRRGELHRLDGNWTNALADLARAARLNPKLDLVELERGRVYFDAAQPERAVPHLDQFLLANPTNAVALVTRARCRAWLGRHREAVDDFSAAILASPAAGPDLHLERATALHALGIDGDREALKGLNDAIASIGPVLTLQAAALDLEVQLKSWDAALSRIGKLSEASPRRDRWLMRKAEVLELAGRTAEARAAWREAQREFEALPERMRTTPAGQKQAAQLKSALAEKRP